MKNSNFTLYLQCMKYVFLVFILVLLSSCEQKDVPKTEQLVVKSNMQTTVKHPKFTTVKSKYKVHLVGWKHYKDLAEFIVKFQEVSPRNALSNSYELRDLVKDLKKNKPKKLFDTNAFKARVNILNNETLRLADISNIHAISAKEVNQQVAKVLMAFSSLNKKINEVYTRKDFEESIDVEDISVGLDSTKLDSVSLKSVKSIDLEEQE